MYPHGDLTSKMLPRAFVLMYWCVPLLPILKAMKSKQCMNLTDQHLTELFWSTLTSFMPNFKTLVSRMQADSK